jgi:hypothetical protein
MDINRFPFDRHNCQIQLTVASDQEDVILNVSTEMDLDGVPDGFRGHVPFPGVSTTFIPGYSSPVGLTQPLVEFDIVFERDPTFVMNAHVMVGWLLVMLAMCSFCATRRQRL